MCMYRHPDPQMPAARAQSEVEKLMNVLVSFPPDEQETLAAHYRAAAEHIRDVDERLDTLPSEQVTRLRQLLHDGMESGEPREIDTDAIKKRGRARLAAERKA